MKTLIIIAVVIAAYFFIFRLIRMICPPECKFCGTRLNLGEKDYCLACNRKMNEWKLQGKKSNAKNKTSR